VPLNSDTLPELVTADENDPAAARRSKASRMKVHYQ
jgi:hypothetical protein